MSEKERTDLIEELLPSLESILTAYREQGRELTREEAERIREQIRKRGISTPGTTSRGTNCWKR